MSRIQARFAAVKAEGRGALIPFLEAYDPDEATSMAILRGMPGAGADLIEIGMPFTDPMADGPTIQAAGLRALKAGQTLAKTLEMVRGFRAQDGATPIVLMGYYNPIYIHGAVERLCGLYEEYGVPLGELRPATGVKKDEMRGHIVVCPPAALNDRWSRRLPDPITAMASGWMRVRQRARMKNVELPLIISDHADWDELTATLSELSPKEVWVTHGREEALIHWCAMHQIKARELNLVGYEDEDD